MTGAEFWNRAWASDIVPTRAAHDPILERHWPAAQIRAGAEILVPLSGASADLTWLASRGYRPVGVEISAIPCARYFADRGVVPDRHRIGPFVAWRGGGVTVMQGDFFNLGGTYDAAVDRGALVAVPPSDRDRYAEHLLARLAPGGAILLVTIEFDATRRNRPPYPLFPEDVTRLLPGAVERARYPLDRPRWNRIGGATNVVWTAEAC